MTLQEITDQKIKEKIEDFHFWVDTLGIKKAKEIILNETGFKAVIDYVNNYRE